MKVIIDNGHGVDTPGKRSPIWDDGTRLYEYEFNRDIAKRLAIELRRNNIECVFLVTELEDVSLKDRARRANAYYAKNPDSFLVSIHANAGGGTGWEVFTSRGETRSDKLADAFVLSAEVNLPDFKIRKDYTDGDADKEANFYILRKTLCPAVLTENLFMDNERDCRFLMSDEGREAVVKLHVDAIVMAVHNKILE